MDNISKEIRINELLDASNSIYNVLYQYKDDLNNIHNTINITSNDIIEFANNITLTLSAPRLYRDGLPLIASHAPCPQLFEMRMGKLANLNSSNVVKQIQEKDKEKDNEIQLEKRLNSIQERIVRQNSNNNSNSNSNNNNNSNNNSNNSNSSSNNNNSNNNNNNNNNSNNNGNNNNSNNSNKRKREDDNENKEDDDEMPNRKLKVEPQTNEAKANSVQQAPKRVINISFGLSDSDSD